MQLVGREQKIAFYGVPGTTTYTATATAGASNTGVTAATVVGSTFASQVNNAAGTYNFSYDGTDWKLNGSAVTIANYGITLTGSAASGDTLAVALTVTVPHTYKRMQGFTSLTTNKNAKEYSRHYVDEKNERTDVTGFAPSMSFSFDQMEDLDVHKDLVSIIDGEKIGTAAVRPIVIVDLTTKTGAAGSETYSAKKRDFSVVPGSEGDGNDAYTYGGDFKANGETSDITGSLSSDGLTFTPAS